LFLRDRDYLRGIGGPLIGKEKNTLAVLQGRNKLKVRVLGGGGDRAKIWATL